MCSERDGNAYWYHFFERSYNGEEAFLDLTYGRMDYYNSFLVFDWLESAGENKVQDIADNFDIMFRYERVVPISEVKKTGEYAISGKVTEAEVVKRESKKGGRKETIRVTMEDGTGSILCYLTLDPSDINCITGLCESQDKVIVSGWFLEDEKGDIYME